VGLGIKSNINECFDDLSQAFENVKDIAMPRALNTLRDQAQVAGLRKVSDIYGIGPRTTEQYVSVTFADATDLEATISVKGRGFTLEAMQPRQTRAGVTVTIKGKRILVPHSFMISRFGSHVFARGSYAGKSKGTRPTGEAFGRFTFGKGRLPISELFTFGPVEAFSNPEVTEAMQDRVDEQAPAIIAREIKAAARGF